MKDLETLNAEVEKTVTFRNETKATKLKALVLCIQDCLSEIIFGDNLNQLEKLLGNNDVYISHSTNRSSISRITLRFGIESGKIWVQLSAHDQYYDPWVALDSFSEESMADKTKLSHFAEFKDRHAEEFEDWLFNGTLDCSGDVDNCDFEVASIIKGINEYLYEDAYKLQMNELRWSFDDFMSSDYAFKLSDEEFEKAMQKCSEYVKSYSE